MTEHSGATINLKSQDRTAAQNRAEAQQKRFNYVFEILKEDKPQDISKLRFLISDYNSTELNILVNNFIKNKYQNFEALSVLLEYGANEKKALIVAKEVFPDEKIHKGLGILDDEEIEEFKEIAEIIKDAAAKAKLPKLEFINNSISEEELIDLIEKTSSKHLDARINGETLLTFAAKAKYFDAVDLLLERGANPKVLDLNGKSALDYLNLEAASIDRSEPDAADLSFMKQDVIHRVDQMIDKFEEYLERNSFSDMSTIDSNVTKVAQIMAKDKVRNIHNFRKLLEEVKQDDLTKLAKYFVQNDYSNIEALRLMFDYGANQNQVKDIVSEIHPQGTLWNSQKRNAYEALFNDIKTRPEFPRTFDFKGEKELIEFVRKISAKDIDNKDKNSATLLTYAAEKEYFDAVKSILEKGANPNLADSNGKNAYDYLSAAEDDELGQNNSRLGFLTSNRAQKALELIESFGGKPSSAFRSSTSQESSLKGSTAKGVKFAESNTAYVFNAAEPSNTPVQGVREGHRVDKREEPRAGGDKPESSDKAKSDNASAPEEQQFQLPLNHKTNTLDNKDMGLNDLFDQNKRQPQQDAIPAASSKPPELFIDEDGQITQLIREVVKDKNLVHHKHPESKEILVEEKGNDKKGYSFEPTKELIELGQEIIIEIPCVGKDGKMLQDKKEKLIFDPVTREIVEYSIPEGFNSRIDQKWLATLKEKPGLSHATISTRAATKEPVMQGVEPERVMPHMEEEPQREVCIYQIMGGRDNSLVKFPVNFDKDGVYRSSFGEEIHVDKEKGTIDMKGKNGAAVAGNYLIEFSSSQDSNRKDILIFEKGVLQRVEYSAAIYQGNVSGVQELTEKDRELLKKKPVSLPVILSYHSSSVKGAPSYSTLPHNKRDSSSGLIK